MTNPRAGGPIRALVLAACLTLVLASCGGGDDDMSVPTPAAETGSVEGSPSGAQDDPSVSLQDAASAAVKAVDGSSLLTIETEPGRTVWEATVVTGDGTEHEMLISMSDGSMLDGPTKKFDDAEDKAENRDLVAAAELDYREAARAVIDAVPNARLTELNLGTFEDRITVWEGDLYGTEDSRYTSGVRYSVTIDAKTGNVLEKDADAEDND